MRTYSHSALASFESCPRQFFWRHVARPDIEKVETIEAFMGTRVHETLEALYRLALEGRVLTADEAVADYERRWDRHWSEDVRVVRRDLEASDYRAVGRDCVATYLRRHGPLADAQTLRLEARVSIDLDGSGHYRFVGFIDRIARRADGTYEIHDYKTSAHLPTQAEADRDRQLALYQIGLGQMWADVRAVDLVWHYLRFDTDLVSGRDAAALDDVRSASVRTIDDIEARGAGEAGFPTNRSRLCRWCEFESICPATRHPAAVAALPAREVREDAGVQLVDAWAELRARRRALAAEAEALRAEERAAQERVEAFAARQGLEAVAGTRYEAVARRKVEVGYPRAEDDVRPAFEQALRDSGVWDLVAGFDHHQFVSAWSSPAALSAEQREALDAFVTSDETLSCTLRRINEPDD